MKKNVKLTTILAIATTVILLTTSIGWMADSTTLNAAQEDTPNEGDTFRLPPPVNTAAHDEWIEWYRTAEFDGLDHHTRDIILILHDFEADFHPDLEHDASWEVVALLAQKEMMQGIYPTSNNEQLLYSWLMGEYSPPSDINTIDRILLNIVGSADHMHRAHEVYEAAMFGASIGYVPDDLRDLDNSYWGREMFIATCDLIWDDCNPEEMRESIAANRELTPEEIAQLEADLENNPFSNTPDPILHESYMLPQAHAKEQLLTTGKYHRTFLNINAPNCSHQYTLGCSFNDRATGSDWNYVYEASTNHHDANQDSPHTSANVKFYASAGATLSTEALSQAISIIGKIDLPSDGSAKTDYGTTFVDISDTWNPPGANHSYGAEATSRATVTYN